MTWQFSPLTISLITLIVWAIIVLAGEMLQAGRAVSLERLVSKHLVYSLVAAPIFLLAIIAYTGWWREVGLQFEGSINNIKLLVVPALAIIVIWVVAFRRRLHRSKTLIVSGTNTFVVGVSEELMFRGILFYGCQAAFGSRWAVVVTAIPFGLIHALNGLITGKPGQAIVQAFFATVFGFWIAVLRVHMDTIIPLIMIHWLWDFGLAAGRTDAKSVKTVSKSVGGVLPLACEAVLFAYGLWLYL
jgi:membrane protease YdiL (CAAX protease family)